MPDTSAALRQFADWRFAFLTPMCHRALLVGADGDRPVNQQSAIHNVTHQSAGALACCLRHFPQSLNLLWRCLECDHLQFAVIHASLPENKKPTQQCYAALPAGYQLIKLRPVNRN